MGRRRGKGIGPILLTTYKQSDSAPRVSGCGSPVQEVDGETGAVVKTSHAKGYAIRYRGGEAVVIAVRCQYAAVPRSLGMWLRGKRRHLLWVLRLRQPGRAGSDGAAQRAQPKAHGEAWEQAQEPV